MANILIVDDSRTSRRILRSILEEDGHVIVGEATNGQEGFEQYMSLKPDIVTMDITMPVMTGVEALKKIIEADSNAKVVMVSAAGQQHNMLEAVQSGAADFISKPFDVDTIKNMVKKIVG
ncbi:MAG: response regulator [Lachnospiraceae bacterium]|nr:response regulator [Lachnospiraceae bacterium]